MDHNEAKSLIDTFRAYRELLDPIQTGLGDFLETYDSLRGDIDTLNNAFSGGIKENLDNIYKTLSAQAAKASDLSTRIDQFTRMTNKYVNEVTELLQLFTKVEQRITVVNELETRAEEQIGRLDKIIDEKNKNYNVKELQKSLDSYNSSVQKVSEFINRDVAATMSDSQKKLETIKNGVEGILGAQKESTETLEKMLESHQTSTAFLRRITEQGDVNETYLFELLDKWAETRKVKTKK